VNNLFVRGHLLAQRSIVWAGFFSKSFTPFTLTRYILLILLPNHAIFVSSEVLGGGLKLFFEPKNQIPNVWGF
jgi:hypothetical protein